MIRHRCFIRCLLCLMCALATGIADARTLHVGNKSFALSQTKYTTPSLAFAVPNEATWYAPLTTTIISNTLHVKTSQQEYYVDALDDYAAHIAETCPQIFTDTVNYTYDNDGRLIGADENLWIKSNIEGPYIDVGFIPNSETRVYTKMFLTGVGWAFVSRVQQNVNTYGFLWAANNQLRMDYGTTQNYSISPTQGIYVIDKNKNITTYMHPNGNTYTISQPKQTFTTPRTMHINMADDGSGNLVYYKDRRTYYFKIWDDGVLVRDMVPVPACMRIGDFIVPENGMWDIVEQKFYGNANTIGTFIYGKDE